MRAYLQQHAHLTAAELAITLALVRPCVFRRGTELFHPGPVPDLLYFVETGCRALVKAIEREAVQVFVLG